MVLVFHVEREIGNQDHALVRRVTNTAVGGRHHGALDRVFDLRKGSSMGLLLLIVLVVLLMGGLPRWGHSRDWGYGPSGVLALVLVVVLVLVLMGHIPNNF